MGLETGDWGTGQNEAQHADKTHTAFGRAPTAQLPSFPERSSARSGQNWRVMSVQTCFTAPDQTRTEFDTRDPKLATRNFPFMSPKKELARPGDDIMFRRRPAPQPKHAKAIRPLLAA